MWAHELQVLDLVAGDRLEMVCRRCGHLHYVTAAELLANPANRQRWLDDVARRARCRARGCGGPVRMALIRTRKTSGFVGGIA